MSLLILACTATSLRSRSPQANPQHPVEVDVKGARSVFIPAAGSDVELKGTTNVSAWKSRSTDIHGKVALDTDAAALNALFDRIQSAGPNAGNQVQLNLPSQSPGHPAIADILVPVASLHGDSIGMDHDMQKALKAAQHPMIEYVFQQLQNTSVQWDPEKRQGGLKLRVAGKLEMAGVVRPIAMDVFVRRDSEQRFHARAQTTLLMSDFAVTPPVALFGLIKGDNRVDVTFDLDLVLTHDSRTARPAVQTSDLRRQ